MTMPQTIPGIFWLAAYAAKIRSMSAQADSSFCTRAGSVKRGGGYESLAATEAVSTQKPSARTRMGGSMT